MPDRPALVAKVIQGALVVSSVAGALVGQWSLVFVGLAALALTYLPHYFAHLIGVRLPRSFLSAIVFFIFATVFLGEAFDFYERYWWWDIALHFGSAVSFGMFSFLFIFVLFEGDRYAAPPSAIALLSFCVAMSVGAIWEVFEFAMDQIFGLNMQKSGLIDTMYDLIVDMAGATLGAMAGYLYLKGRQLGGLGAGIEEFVRLNKKLFAKIRDR